jgi:hypothetical protein
MLGLSMLSECSLTELHPDTVAHLCVCVCVCGSFVVVLGSELESCFQPSMFLIKKKNSGHGIKGG